MSEPQPTTRFYETARAEEIEGGFGILLDDLQLKSPKGTIFAAPTLALAVACADEWNAQGQRIRPADMPLTRLSFAAIDLALLHGRALADHVAKYAETDLVCHRAEGPGPLVKRQHDAWDPIVDWAAEALSVRLPVVTGVIAADASPDIALLRLRLDTIDDFRLTGVAHAVALTGSALIGMALLEGRLDCEGAYLAASVDERWNAEMWGLDKEADARLKRMRGELHAVGDFFAALR